MSGSVVKISLIRVYRGFTGKAGFSISPAGGIWNEPRQVNFAAATKTNTMRFEKHPITALIPADYNPRKKLKPGDPEFEKIKTSIEEFGYTDPIIVNGDMTIIGGHQRWSVLKELGYDEVDCVVVDVDKQSEKALNIALNKITGAWDNEKLADLLRGLQTLDYDATKTGFDPPEMDEIFNSVHSKETREDDCAIPLPENPVTQSGDVWELGRHRLICGDGSAPGVIKTLMEGKKANITIADAPPIGSGNAADYYEMLQHVHILTVAFGVFLRHNEVRTKGNTPKKRSGTHMKNIGDFIGTTVKNDGYALDGLLKDFTKTCTMKHTGDFRFEAQAKDGGMLRITTRPTDEDYTEIEITAISLDA